MLYNENKGTLNQKIYKLNHFIVKTIEKNYQNKKINGKKIIRSTSQDNISKNKNIKYQIILPGKKRRGISDDSDVNSNTNRTESSFSNKNESNLKGGKIRLRLSNHIIKKDPRKYYFNNIEYIIYIQKIWKGFYLRKRINKFLKTYYSIFIFISHFKNLLLKQLFYCIDKIQKYDKNILKKKTENSFKTSSSISKRTSIDNEKFKGKLEIETISSRSSEGKIFNSLYNNDFHNYQNSGVKFFDDNLKEINESNFFIYDKDLSNERKKDNLEYKKLYQMLINKIAILEEKNRQPKLNNELFISNEQNSIQIIPDLLMEKKNNKLENGLIEINRDDNTKENSNLLFDKKSKCSDGLFISNQQNNIQILPLKYNIENNFQTKPNINYRRINNGNISILLEKKSNKIIDNIKITNQEDNNIDIKPNEELIKRDNSLFKGIKIFYNLKEERKISDKIIKDKKEKYKNLVFDNIEIEIKNNSKKELHLEKSKTEFIKVIGKKKSILRKSRVENFKILSKKKPNILKKSMVDYFKILTKKKIIIDKIRNESFIILSEKYDENIYKEDKIANEISNNENFNIFSNKKVIIEVEKKDNFNILSENKKQVKNIINFNFNILTKMNKKDYSITIEKNNLLSENKTIIEKVYNENFNIISKINKNKSNFKISKLEDFNLLNKNLIIKEKKENIIFKISKVEYFNILNKTHIYNEDFINNCNLRYSKSFNNFDTLNNENNYALKTIKKTKLSLEKLKIENLEIIRNELIYIEGSNNNYKSKEVQTINNNNIINNNKEKEYKSFQVSFQIISKPKYIKKRMPSGIIFKNKVIKTEWTKLPFAIEKYAKKFNNRLVCLLIVNYLRRKTKQLRIDNYKTIILKIIKKQNHKIVQKYFYKFQFKVLIEKKLFEQKSEINKNNDLLFDLSFNDTKQLIESNNPKSKDNSLNYINFAEIDYTKELEDPIKNDLKDKIKKIDISTIKSEKKLSILSPSLSPISKRKKNLETDYFNKIINIKEKKIKNILQKKILKKTFSKWKKETEDNINIDESFSFSMSNVTPRTIRVKSKKNNKDVSIRYINKNSNGENIRSISIFSSFNDSFLSLTNNTIKKGMKVVHKIIDYKGKIKNIEPNLYSCDKLNKSNLDINDKNLLNKILSMNKAKKYFVKWKKISKKNKRKFINVIVNMIKCLFSNNILMYESLKVNPYFQIEKGMLIWYRKSKKISKKKNKKYF